MATDQEAEETDETKYSEVDYQIILLYIPHVFTPLVYVT